MKYLKILLFAIVSFIFVGNVHAASGSISVSSSTKMAVVGSTFTVTVKVSCSEALGSWQFGLAYDSAYVSLQSGDTSIAAYGDGQSKVKTYTYKFKAIKSGSASIRITGASMVSWNDVNTLFTPSISNTSVNVKTQKEIEASYSKDNNLKSLSVEGFELSPAFSKDVTEYSINVPDDVLSIKVAAQVNDGKASVRGTGTIDVSEGNNKLEVIVTAQNGSTKTYIINVTVKDLNPIVVNVDGKDLSVVKKESLLTCPTGYTPKTIKINDIDVPGFISEITNFVLVGLKDDAGEINLYRYDEKGYLRYVEVKSKGLTLYPDNAPSTPKGFKKESITINDIKMTSYTSENIGKKVLIYAINVENGYRGFYLYDKDENSFVRYDEKTLEILDKKDKENKFIILAMSLMSLILLCISIVLGRNYTKIKKAVVKKTTNEKENSPTKED